MDLPLWSDLHPGQFFILGFEHAAQSCIFGTGVVAHQRKSEPLIGGGTVEMPCLESSLRTLSVEGGFSPKGSGSHGLFIASFTTLSITSSACKKKIK